MVVRRADPEHVQTRDDLAQELSILRSEAGLTVRDIARAVGAPVATIGDYFSGRHLPGPRQAPLYVGILEACGVRDPALVEAWVAAINRLRTSSDGRTAKAHAPYRGLQAFTDADADLFFGREAAVEELLDHVKKLVGQGPGSGGSVALVAPSGGGKSSLLMAGLLPAVRSGALDDGLHRWDARALPIDRLEEPPHPFRTVSDLRHLVIVDQAESLFTLDAERRGGALASLQALQESCFVVLGLRADFYKTALAEPVLLPALRNQMILRPMDAHELREAITGPVRRVGARIEEGLVDLVLADLGIGDEAGKAPEPGALPLLSFALMATWERAPHNDLTIADYRAVGGVRGAVRRAAEEVYESLDDTERLEARRLFAHLVRVDGEGPPTRRRVRRDDLAFDRDAQSEGPAVLERFVAARLLTADADSVQISHEALLAAWPRLAEWVDADRDWLRLQHQLADAAQAWAQADRDAEQLWRGGRLDTALEAAAGPGRAGDLTTLEREFIDRSSALRHELEAARRRRARRTAQLLGVVAVLAVIAVVLATVAVNADGGANRARDQALSRQVAVEAQQLQSTNPSLAAQLAVAAYRISPTTQAASTLIDATAGEIPTRLFGPIGPTGVSASPEGLVAVCQSATDTVRLYRTTTKGVVRLAQVRVGAPKDADYAVALSADGRLLAAGGTTDSVVLWNVADPRRPVREATLSGLPSTVYSLAFTPQGHELAAGDAAGSVDEWDVTHPSSPSDALTLADPGGAAVHAVAFNRSGTYLAAAGNAGLAVWRTGDDEPTVAPPGSTTVLESVSFGPGTQLVVGDGKSDTVETWSLSATGQLQLAHAPVTAATSEVNATVFSPDGSTIAVGAADGSIKLFTASTLAVVATLGDPSIVTSLAFARGGRDLVSGDAAGTVQVWPLPPPSTYTEPGSVYSLTYSDGGRYLAAGSAGDDGDVTIWGDAQSLHPVRLMNVQMPAGFGPSDGAAAINPAGDLLAVANFTAGIQLFDVSDVQHPVPIGSPLEGNKPNIEQLLFSPNGRFLLAGDDSGQLRVWDVSDPAHPRAMPTIKASGGIQCIAFSPGTKLVATASTDEHVRLYDFADPEHPKLLATVGGFSGYAYTTAFTPDGRTLVAGSADGTIRLWNITDPSRPQALGSPLSVPAGYVFQLSVSPDGRTLAAASTSGGVWMWNIADPAQPQLLANLTAAQDSVFDVLFSPNDRVLVATGSDDTLHLWDYRPAAAATYICAVAGAPITRTEWSQYVEGAPYQPPCR